MKLRVSPFVLIVALSIAFAGCDGGEPEADATPSSRVELAATPTPLPLDEYVILVLRVNQERARLTADLRDARSEPSGDLEAILLALVEVGRTYGRIGSGGVEMLSGVTPPRAAEAYHRVLLDVLGRLEEFGNEYVVAVEAEDVARSAALLLELLELNQETMLLDEQQNQLVIAALQAKGGDALTAYLIAATQIGSDVGEVAETLDSELISLSEDSEREWLELSPPPEAKPLHQRHAELLHDSLEVARLFASAAEREDEAATSEAERRFRQIAIGFGRNAAEWNDLLIVALSR